MKCLCFKISTRVKQMTYQEKNASVFCVSHHLFTCFLKGSGEKPSYRLFD